jgi:uncharacterized protein (TIGR04255 family)
VPALQAEQLSKAPITEALLDIQVRLPNSVTLERLLETQAAVVDEYPVKEERVTWEAGIKLNEDAITNIDGSSKLEGYLFSSTDKLRIFQARLNGFTFNRLRPYTNWAEFVGEAKRLWAIYVDIAKPEIISRIGLRYINHLPVRAPLSDLKDVLLTVPEISPSLPQGLTEYFMRWVIPDEQSRSVAIITQALNPTKADLDSDNVRVILDVDVFRTGAFNPSAPTIWETIEELRTFKNRMFFESLNASYLEGLR